MIRRLAEGDQATLIQDTTFTTDVLGRYICNTWEEAVNNGGAPFDVVVIGAGMFGAYCTEKSYRDGEKAGLRILVLEAGSFLVSEHVQNLARLGLKVPPPITVDPGIAREAVWGLPWRSAVAFPGLAYCIGGRSVFWGGWSPRLTDADLDQWPAEVAADVRATYPNVEREIGVDPSTDFITGPLYAALKQAFDAAAPSVPTVGAVEEGPLAIQGSPPASGLFSFDKYSSAPILTDAVRAAAALPDDRRRLFVVPRAHVTRLVTRGGLVREIEVRVNGEPKTLFTSGDCAVVLAAGTIESTRLALESFPTPLIGRNLMAHLRSNTVVRVSRGVLGPLPQRLEAAALLVRGSTAQGRYHLQVTAAAVEGADSEATMFRMVPDIDLLDRMLASQVSDKIVITLRGIGEMVGDKGLPTPSNSWTDLSPYERDEFGMRRVWVNLAKTPDEELLWKAMDQAALALAQKIANGDPAKIEYLYDGAWHAVPPPPGKVRDTLGTTHHEAGTLWMGDGSDPRTSVTDLVGRFKHVANAYVAGPALFPTIGSANPSLTAFALARRTAKAVAETIAPPLEAGFTPLFVGTLEGWQMAGLGFFGLVGRSLESEGGPGVLWYTKEEFGDFLLKVDWRAANPDDNSGVFVRFPVLGSSDPANDWRLAVDKGYEVQIDDRGWNPDTQTFGDPSRQTGAIYGFAPSSKIVSRPLGQWNTFEITARGQQFSVVLNGEPVCSFTGDGSRPAKGHIGLQNHHAGSRMAFRNIRLKR